MSDSQQHKLDRVRKPQVHITYDVQVGNAREEKELPFVMGVIADLSGDGNKELPAFASREFSHVDRDNFSKFMATQNVRASFPVKSEMPGAGPDATMSVDLRFESMKDFEPEGVIRQIDPLLKLYELRQRLKSMLSRASSSDEVKKLLAEVLTDASQRDALAAELGLEGETNDKPSGKDN